MNPRYRGCFRAREFSDKRNYFALPPPNGLVLVLDGSVMVDYDKNTMTNAKTFTSFFQGHALECLVRAVDLALDEDGPDLTSRAVFSPTDRLTARIVAKQD